MRSRLTIIVALAALAAPLSAQCPDGTPPPCGPGRAIDPNAVAILPFSITSRSPDALLLRDGLPDLLFVALDGVGGWRIIDPRVASRRAGAFDPADVDRVRAIARQLGAAQVVIGRVLTVGPELRSRVELLSTSEGRRATVLEARGLEADPRPMVDSIAVALARERARVSGTPARALPVGEYTTSSPAALRLFLVAEGHARRGEWQAAADTLQRAIALDSAFGLAYLRLIEAVGWDATIATPIDALAHTGLRYASGLPPRQRGVLNLWSTYDEPELLRRADQLVAQFPRDAEVAFLAADFHVHVGPLYGETPGQLLQGLLRSIDLDPDAAEAHAHAATLYAILGDTSAAWAALDRARALAPGWILEDVVGLSLRIALRGESPRAVFAPLSREQRQRWEGLVRSGLIDMYDAAPAVGIALAESVDAAVIGPEATRGERAAAMRRRSRYRLAQGRRAEAWSAIEESQVLEPNDPVALSTMVLMSLVTGERVAERDAAAGTLAAHADVPWPIRAVPLWHMAQAGPQDSIGPAVERALTPPPTPIWSAYRASLTNALRGLVLIARGDTAGARPFLAAHFGFSSPTPGTISIDPFVALQLARADRNAGDLAAARAHLEYVRYFPGLTYRAEAEELKAQIAEQQGDTTAAITAWTSFIALWQDADPPLQPRVAAARAALARLQHP